MPKPPEGRTGWPWTIASSGAALDTTDVTPWPLFSVVTPSYNQAAFIEETIRSVLLQGYPNLEYIVIDGGSTDESMDIIRKYEPWLAYWVSERDGGQSNAINKGWLRSRGSIVAWLNSDDLYAPGTLGKVANAFGKDGAGLVYGDYTVIDERSRTTRVVKLGDFDLRAHLRRNVIPQPSAFLRRQVLDAVGLLDEQLRFVMDYDLWLRAAGRSAVRHESGVWASFRVCSGTKSFSNPEAFVEETVEVLRHHLRNKTIAEAGFSLREVRGRALLNAGLACYDFKQFREARHYFLRAIRTCPQLALRSPALIQLLRAMLQRKEIASAIINS